MEYYDAVRSRFSVRAFRDTAVEPEKITRILDAARLAPSAKNMQESRYVVVTDPRKRAQLAEAAYGQQFVAQAPVVIVCCSISDRSTMKCGHARYTIDAGIAIEHMALAAVAEGLGSCWIGSFSPEKTREILGIPEEVEVVELLPIGYPAANAKPVRGRKALDQLVCYESWTL
jgi:nitroreductase